MEESSCITAMRERLHAATASIEQALRAKEQQVREEAAALKQRKADMVARTTQIQEGAWEKGPPLQLNVGGCILDLKRSTVLQASGSMLARMFSGRWDHVLPRDKSGRIFLDLDEKWAKPIFQHLYYLSLAHDSSETLETPESTFQDSDDLMGYYATLDFLGLTETFYPDGVQLYSSTKPLGIIDLPTFIQKLQPVLSCYWRAPWRLLYKTSTDGFDLNTYQNCCINIANTVVFIKERGTANVYGGYSAVAKAYPTT
eukprot:13832-Heterococcus_DN1.PRE.2